jgi:hypothetical protein
MNVHGAACQDAGTGQSFAMWTLSRVAKSMTSVYSAGEGANKSPDNRRENRTPIPLMRLSSPPSTLRIPNRNSGRDSVHQGGLQLTV